ncbi:MAG: phosphoglycerate dehydrogenase [Thermoflexales bacterium]|nr:phosphoglycerate dehydrogenase [Thermoflexales bacterium]
MYRILIADDIGEAGLALLDAAPDVAYDVLAASDLPQQIAGAYDALITLPDVPLGAELFEAAGRLQLVARAGVGLDNVDLEAATRRGIMVMNAPEANTVATVELTIALMLASCRRLVGANRSVQGGEWTRGQFLGTELRDKTLGIVGLGRIGAQVAVRCQAFGMKVMAYDPYITEEEAEALHVRLASLDQVLAQADVLTFHASLTDETRGMIAAPQLALMKDGVCLVNCAAPELWDEEAVHAGLVSGKIASAALDLSSPTQATELRRLLSLDNVIATPHLSVNTVEAQRGVGVQVVQQALDALRGTQFHHVVNLPFAEGVDQRALAPYLTLAEKIGSLHMQLAHGRVGRVELEFRGEEVEPHVRPLMVALLKGLLTPILGDKVNYVNAPKLAEERGLLISQARYLATQDYSNMILCRAASPEQTRLIGGALFLRTHPRIVLLDELRLDALPEGWALLIASRNAPGVIGQIGLVLGKHNVNIAEWRLGREDPGLVEMSFVNVDTPASEAALADLRALPSVTDVQQVLL